MTLFKKSRLRLGFSDHTVGAKKSTSQFTMFASGLDPETAAGGQFRQAAGPTQKRC